MMDGMWTWQRMVQDLDEYWDGMVNEVVGGWLVK